MKFERIPDRNVSLKYLQITSSNECLTKVKAYLTIIDFNYKIYGISQNPDTRNYIMVFKNGYCVKCGEKYTKEKYKWLFSAIWKSGPLNYNYSKMKLKKIPNRNVSLKHLHNTNINEFLTKVKTYLTNTDNCKMYGISQHPDTKNFIIVLQDKYYIEYNKNYCERCNDIYTNIKYKWCSPCQTNNLKLNFSGNKIINDLILEMQLKINSPFDRVFEWIPCNQFNDIKEIGKDDYDINNINEFLNKVRIHSTSTQIYGLSQNSSTDDFIIIFESKYCEEYSKRCCEKCMEKYTNIMYKWSIWKNGPLYYNHSKNEYIRKLNKKITLKCLHNSRSTINEFINKVNSFLTNKDNIIFKTYGISQNPDTGNYIIVLQDKYYKEYGKSYCKQCIGKYTDIENKWSIWKDGPLCYDNNKMELKRASEKMVTLKCLHYNIYNLQNIINKFLNKVNAYAGNSKIYGMSQNPITKDYIMILQEKYCTEYGTIYCEECDEKYTNAKYKWLYSAIWKGGPLYYDHNSKKWIRKADENVVLKCLITNEFLNMDKAYSTDNDKMLFKVYGISQNPQTKDYIIVLHYNRITEIYERYVTNLFYNLPTNEKIIDFIHNVVFEWISYNQFDEIEEICKDGFDIVNSAIWEDGLLYFDDNKKKWTRKSNIEVTLKYISKF
ncbi:kinase-like domain-containing protein [Rhizophagus irregularis DAOM 181602=DAOM 197198]|nr:kinase-like domain-containing protein [Rhizophagus irregularis DAOM 181602=DAOM 197198]